MSNTDNPYSAGYGGGAGAAYTHVQGEAADAAPVPTPPEAAPAATDGLIGGGSAAGSADEVFDVSTQTFMSDVMEASSSVPVIVDFWAPWCGPCKQLGPVIEKVVRGAKGKVRLAKMDIEQHPDIAGQMGIQSIPAVVAFIDGRPADAFMGAKGEREVQAFVDQVIAKKPTEAAQDMAQVIEEADRLAAAKDHGGAAELYGSVLQREPDNADALAGLGQCYIAVGEVDMARQLVASLPDEAKAKGRMAALVKALELADQAESLGDLTPLSEAVDANPDDHQARYDYAVALNAAGKRTEAADALLAIVRKDREWNDDGARAKLVEFFEAWGNMDPATIAARRSLSSILFS